MKLLRLFLAIFLISLALRASAEPTPLELMQAARDFRQELALSVSQNIHTPGKALALLRASKSASGRAAAAADEDLAYAALDVGYRLMALERPDLAEDFFRVAEQGFEVELKRSSLARERAELLHHLAEIRGKFLGRIDQAKADIDEAIQLQPDDSRLQETRRLLARGCGEHFKQGGKN